MTDSSYTRNIESELRVIESEKHGSYDKRTEHLDEDGLGIFINRLIREDSPYLLQHAHNPVDWYPWGEEAFARARDENKPVFLSIGYSTCHWCHVMEVESFDNVEVARFLNAHFVSIKMDREQYPDIDEVYMTGVQLMSGQGGWPMSNFLMPDGKPFFGATYFPPPTFLKLLQQIEQAWRDKHEELANSAASISQAIDRVLSERKAAAQVSDEAAGQVSDALLRREDKSWGGMAGAPKFPQEPLLLFMLDRALRDRDLAAFDFCTRALNGMGQGGIYDQVGGGFHRYSVDAEWLVPHFEKMLYNQSQLSLVYLQAYSLCGDPFYLRLCTQTLDYVLREMQIPDGGFYSATDADSEGAEGTFFLWSADGIRDVLDGPTSKLVESVYGVNLGINFEGANILYLPEPLLLQQQAFEEAGGSDFLQTLDRARDALREAREVRPHPLRDDKLIVAWSAAMITSLARAGEVLQRADYLAAAQRAADFILASNRRDDGRLWRIYLDGTCSIDGQLEDYGNLIEALITLFDISRSSHYLEAAGELMQTLLQEFWIEDGGGFYLGPAHQPGPQLTRSRNAGDGATLSPVATVLHCLVMLDRRSALLADAPPFREFIDRCIAALGPHVNEHPLNHGSVLRAIVDYRRPLHGAEVFYAAQGLARIQVKRETESIEGEVDRARFTFLIELVEGWHLTAATAAAGDYRPVQVAASDTEQHWQLQEVAYPAASGTITQENDSIGVLKGKVNIEASYIRTDIPEDQLSNTIAVQLILQLCNEERCLLPETHSIRL